jgi:hypothetical protein
MLSRVTAIPGVPRRFLGQSAAAEGDDAAQPRTGTPAPPGISVTVSNSRQEMMGKDADADFACCTSSGISPAL